MISPAELSKAARALGVPLTTVERDYAQGWFLKALYSTGFKAVLKGGTCVRKAYIPDYRFSDDLDFTQAEEAGERALSAIISKAAVVAREESGIGFEEEVRLKANENGFEGAVRFAMGGATIKIKLDVTRFGAETVALGPVDKRILHGYSDGFAAVLSAYRLEEIVAEKLRALFERTRPRDVYDAFRLSGAMEMSVVRPVFAVKCASKGLAPDVPELESRRPAFERAWKASLAHQMAGLPAFPEAFSSAVRAARAVA